MFGFFKQQFAIWRFQRSTLGQALRQHTYHYFHEVPSLSYFSQENKEKFAKDFTNKLAAIVASPNSFLALRETLTEHVISFAQLAVLTLTEDELAQADWRDSPFISGQLHHHIDAAAEHHEELARYKWESEGVMAQDLIAFANTRGALLLYYINGLNMVRLESGDNAERDWFKPFVEAMLVWEEHTTRQNIGLPSLFDDPVGGLCYSTYMNYVVDGALNPFFEFTKNFPDRYLAGEGPSPPR
jgi:hypothetical protein